MVFEEYDFTRDPIVEKCVPCGFCRSRAFTGRITAKGRVPPHAVHVEAHRVIAFALIATKPLRSLGAGR